MRARLLRPARLVEQTSFAAAAALVALTLLLTCGFTHSQRMMNRSDHRLVTSLAAPLWLTNTSRGSQLRLTALATSLGHSHFEIQHQVLFSNVPTTFNKSSMQQEPFGVLSAPHYANESGAMDSYHAAWWLLANVSDAMSVRDYWDFHQMSNASVAPETTFLCPPGMCIGSMATPASIAVRVEARFPWDPSPSPDVSCQVFSWRGHSWRNISSAFAFATSRHPFHVSNRVASDWATAWQDGWQSPRTRAELTVALHRSWLGVNGSLSTKSIEVHAGSEYLSPWGPGIAVAVPHQLTIAENSHTPVDVRPSVLQMACARRVDRVFSGTQEYCALFNDGKITCWGRNTGGKLGYGTEADVGASEFPSEYGFVPLHKAAADISLSRRHTCVIFVDGSAQCYGRNVEGQLLAHGTDELYIGDDELPRDIDTIRLPQGQRIVAFTAGEYTTCAVTNLSTNNVFCWGGTGRNLLALASGQQTMNSRLIPSREFMDAQVNLQGKTAIAVVAGSYHQCVLLLDNSLVCWGAGEGTSGVLTLGSGTSHDVSDPARITLDGAVNFGTLNNSIASVSLKEQSTCVLFFNGNYMCFGENRFGMFGTGSWDNIGSPGEQADPPQIDSGGNFVALDVGVGVVCALTFNGDVYCLGSRGASSGTRTGGNFNMPNDRFPNVPPVDLGAKVDHVVAGRFSGCALLGSGAVSCWGRDEFGEAADSSSASLEEVAPWVTKAQTSLDRESDLCRAPCVVEDGVLLHCTHPTPEYANAALPPLDTPRTSLSAWIPASNGYGLIQFSTSFRQSCILDVYGQVRCWGLAIHDGLGVPRGSSGSTMPAFGNPEAVLQTRATTVQCLSNGFFIVTQAGGVKFFGFNTFGVAGQGHNLPIHAGGTSPSPVLSGELDTGGPVRSIRVDSELSVCAVSVSGAVMCWGRQYSNSGTLGRGAGVSEFGSSSGETPAANVINVGATALEAKVSYIHACALLIGHRMRCWGSNFYSVASGSHPFGTNFGNEISVSDAPMVPETDRILSFDMSRFAACAIVERAAGSVVRCWGRCVGGACGLPSLRSARTPYSASEDIQFNRSAVAIVAGREHFCSLLASGRLHCWGRGDVGQLGLGSPDSVGVVNSAIDAGAVNFNGLAVVHISCGYRRCGAILEDGGLVVWGLGTGGANGYGSGDSEGDSTSIADLRVQVKPSIVFIPPLSTFSAVSFGFTIGAVEPVFTTSSDSVLFSRQLLSPFTHFICENCDVSRLQALPRWFDGLLFREGQILMPFSAASAGDACREASLELGDVANLNSICIWPDVSSSGIMAISSSIGNSHVDLTAAGGDLLRLRGQFWAAQLLAPDPITVKIGSQECLHVRISSVATELECTAPPLSSNASHSASIELLHSISSLVSPVSAPFQAQYELPRIDGSFPNSGINIFGGQQVLLQGSGFGVQAAASSAPGLQPDWLKVLVGSGGLECSDVRILADSSLSCTMPAEYGEQLLRVTVANASSGPFTVSYGAPEVVSTNPSRLFLSPLGFLRPPSLIQLLGSNLARRASDITVSIGGVPCTGVLYANSSFVSCLLDTMQLDSASSFAEIFVSTGSSAPSLSRTTIQTFGEMRVFAADPVPFNNSGQELVVDGLNFGRPAVQDGSALSDVQRVVLGNAPFAFDCANVTILTINRLRCTLPPGVGRAMSISVQRVQGWTAGFTNANLRYTQPIVSSISPSTILSAPVSTFATLAFHGAAFGSAARPTPTGELSASVGNVPCANTSFVSSTELACLIDLQAFASLAGLSSVSLSVAGQHARIDAAPLRIYGTPRLSSLSPAQLPISGGIIQLDGTEFGRSFGPLGAQPDVLSVQLGPSRHTCMNITSTSSSRLNCRLGPVTGSLSPVVLQRRFGAQATLVDDGLFVRPGQVSALLPSYSLAPPLGQQLFVDVLFVGSDFTAAFAANSVVTGAVQLSIDQVMCATVVFRNSSELQCRGLPVHLLQPSAAHKVSVHVANISALTGQVAFEQLGQPAIDSVVPAIASAAGGQLVSVLGQNFGYEQHDVVSVQIGSANCSNVVLQSSRRIQCVSPRYSLAAEGFGNQPDLPVSVTLRSGARTPLTTGVLQYDLPDIYLVSPTEMLSGHPSAVDASVDVLVVGNALGDPTKPTNSSMIIAGVNCTQAGGHVLLEQGGGSLTCRGLPLARLPTEVAVDSSLARVEVHTNVGLFVASELGTVQVMAPPEVAAVQPNPARVGDSVIIVGSNFGWQRSDIEAVLVGRVEVPPANIERTGVGGLRLVLPPAWSDEPLDNIGLHITVRVASGWSATSATDRAGFGIFSYLRTPSAPITAPSSIDLCGYREAADNGLVRMEFHWPGDAVTAQFPVSQWAVQFSSTPWFVGAGDQVIETRTISNIVGDDVSYVSAPSSQCATSVATTATPSQRQATGIRALQLVDNSIGRVNVRVLSTPDQPFWLRVAAITDAARPVDSRGPFSEALGPIYPICQRNQYLSSQFASRGLWREAVCRDCPDGALCGGEPWEKVTNNAGFYRVPWSLDAMDFAECVIPEACPADIVVHSQPNSTVTPPGVFSAGRASDVLVSCAEGYSGPLCANCAEGFAPQVNQQCAECASQGAATAGFIFGLIGGMLALSLLMRTAIKSRGNPSKPHVALAKLLFVHLQQIALAAAFPMEWPAALRGMFAVFDAGSSLGDTLLSVDCLRLGIASSFVGNRALQLMLPLLGLVVLAVFWATAGAVGACWARLCASRTGSVASNGASATASQIAGDDTESGPSQSQEAPMSAWTKFVVCTFVLFFVLQLNLTKSSLSLFTCNDISGRRLLVGDLQFDCDDQANHSWMYGLGITSLFAYAFGVSALTGMALYCKRDSLQHTKTRSMYGFLYSVYRPEYWYWELVIQSRKICLAFIGVLLRPEGIGAQATFATTLMVFSSLAHNAALPFTSGIMNHFENASIVVTLITLSGGSTLIDPRATVEWKNLISVLIVLSNSIYFACICFILVRLFCADGKTQDAIAAALEKVSVRSGQKTQTSSPRGKGIRMHVSPFATKDSPARMRAAQKEKSGQPAALLELLGGGAARQLVRRAFAARPATSDRHQQEVAAKK